ncbi:MAG: phosphatidylserine decarboxylase [Armatimonadetes bacterium]|nr:phosphatidylserine decarboxylase [Armatimonadota bacterium]
MVIGVIAGLSLLFVWYTRKIWFFRDPDHLGTEQDDLVLRSPVYGRVAYIRRIENGSVESEKKGERILISDITKDDWPDKEGDGWLIGIAMTALDVHYQYSPMPATVCSIRHHAHGRNLPMFDLWEYVRITWLRRGVQLFAKKYVFENERQTMWLKGKEATIALVLIADKFVSKISTFVKDGDSVPAGGKLSFIGRGSQVDVVVRGQPDLLALVQVGQAVHGPSTVIARLRR